MRRDGQTIRTNEMDLGKVKARTKRIFSEEGIAVVFCRIVVAGYLGIVLAHVLQSY